MTENDGIAICDKKAYYTRPGTQRVIMILGMDYTGGSTIADILKALNTQVLDHTIPLFKPDNPRGWWEQGSIAALNERVLNALEMHWHNIGFIEPTAWHFDSILALKQQAVNSMRTWMGDFPYWAFQDPRAGRLLPFWQDVFGTFVVEANYVLKPINGVNISK